MSFCSRKENFPNKNASTIHLESCSPNSYRPRPDIVMADLPGTFHNQDPLQGEEKRKDQLSKTHFDNTPCVNNERSTRVNSGTGTCSYNEDTVVRKVNNRFRRSEKCRSNQKSKKLQKITCDQKSNNLSARPQATQSTAIFSCNSVVTSGTSPVGSDQLTESVHLCLDQVEVNILCGAQKGEDSGTCETKHTNMIDCDKNMTKKGGNIVQSLFTSMKDKHAEVHASDQPAVGGRSECSSTVTADNVPCFSCNVEGSEVPKSLASSDCNTLEQEISEFTIQFEDEVPNARSKRCERRNVKTVSKDISQGKGCELVSPPTNTSEAQTPCHVPELNLSDFAIQFEDDPVKKDGMPVLETVTESRLKKKRRQSRLSTDIDVANVIISPVVDNYDLPLPVDTGSVRRSSRLRRKSVELCRSSMKSAKQFSQSSDSRAKLCSSPSESVPGMTECSSQSVVCFSSKDFSPAGCSKLQEPQSCIENCVQTKLPVIDKGGSVEIGKSTAVSCSDVKKCCNPTGDNNVPFKSVEDDNNNAFEHIGPDSADICMASNQVQNRECCLEPSQESTVTGRPVRTRTHTNPASSRNTDISTGSVPLQVKKGRRKSKLVEINIEDLYLNKNFKMPGSKSWETIYESPGPSQGVLGIGKRKLKRSLMFDEDPNMQAKFRKRRKKAIKNGWKPFSKATLEKADQKLSEKLEKLEEELELLSGAEAEMTGLQKCHKNASSSGVASQPVVDCDAEPDVISEAKHDQAGCSDLGTSSTVETQVCNDSSALNTESVDKNPENAATSESKDNVCNMLCSRIVEQGNKESGSSSETEKESVYAVGLSSHSLDISSCGDSPDKKSVCAPVERSCVEDDPDGLIGNIWPTKSAEVASDVSETLDEDCCVWRGKTCDWSTLSTDTTQPLNRAHYEEQDVTGISTVSGNGSRDSDQCEDEDIHAIVQTGDEVFSRHSSTHPSPSISLSVSSSVTSQGQEKETKLEMPKPENMPKNTPVSSASITGVGKQPSTGNCEDNRVQTYWEKMNLFHQIFS